MVYYPQRITDKMMFPCRWGHQNISYLLLMNQTLVLFAWATVLTTKKRRFLRAQLLHAHDPIEEKRRGRTLG